MSDNEIYDEIEEVLEDAKLMKDIPFDEEKIIEEELPKNICRNPIYLWWALLMLLSNIADNLENHRFCQFYSQKPWQQNRNI